MFWLICLPSVGRCRQNHNRPVIAGNGDKTVTVFFFLVLCGGCNISAQEERTLQLNSPKTITALLTVNLSEWCSVDLKATCCGALILIILSQTDKKTKKIIFVQDSRYFELLYYCTLSIRMWNESC